MSNTETLREAILFRDNNSVEELINSPGVNVNAPNDCLQTALHLAALDGNYEVVSKLLAVPGINANLRDEEGNTPVMIAASYSFRETLKALVNDKGVNLDVKNNDGLGLEEIVGEEDSDNQEIDGRDISRSEAIIQEVIKEGRFKRKIQVIQESIKKRKIEQELANYDDIKEEVRCDPDKIRDELKNKLIEKIEQVNYKREALVETLSLNAELKEKNMEKLEERQGLEKVSLDRQSDEEKRQLEQEKRKLEKQLACTRQKMTEREERWNEDSKVMLSRHTEEKAALEEKYADKDIESRQALLNDLTNVRNQLNDDLKKLDMDPNDIKRLEKARAILECPICMEIMQPPKRIWMCSGSHSICEDCCILLRINLCPTCRTEEVAIRALGMEEMAKALFNP